MFDRLPEDIVSYIFELAHRWNYRTIVVPHIPYVSQARIRRVHLPWLMKTHPLIFGDSSLPQSTLRRVMSASIFEHFHLLHANFEAEDEDHFETSRLRSQAKSLLVDHRRLLVDHHLFQ